MSEELLGVIITSGVTSIISVIGFIVTYKSMKRNFKEELEKEKTSIHIEKMSSIPYEILKLMDNIMQTGGKGDFLNDFTSLINGYYICIWLKRSNKNCSYYAKRKLYIAKYCII